MTLRDQQSPYIVVMVQLPKRFDKNNNDGDNSSYANNLNNRMSTCEFPVVEKIKFSQQ